MKLFHCSHRDILVTTVSRTLFDSVVTGDPFNIWTASGEMSCAILHQLGKYAIDAGVQSLSHVRLFMVDEYEGLPPMHDHSRYFRLAQSITSWPGCSYEDVIVPPASQDETICTKQNPSHLLSKNVVGHFAMVELSEDGIYELMVPPITYTGASCYINLPELFVDKISRMFERYANTPKRVFAVGWRTFLSSKQLLIICSGGHGIATFISLMEDIIPFREKLCIGNSHFETWTDASKDEVESLNAVLRNNEVSRL